jgi:hypothetical protein
MADLLHDDPWQVSAVEGVSQSGRAAVCGSVAVTLFALVASIGTVWILCLLIAVVAGLAWYADALIVVQLLLRPWTLIGLTLISVMPGILLGVWQLDRRRRVRDSLQRLLERRQGLPRDLQFELQRCRAEAAARVQKPS